MYDIHCHILYGLDDGADTLSEAVDMARLAYEGGTKVIAVTPHSNVKNSYMNFWDDTLKSRLAEIQKVLADNEIPVKLVSGQEIFCYDNVLERLKNGDLITLNSSRYALVEFGFKEHRSVVFNKLQKLVAEGYVPVVAHPERYSFIAESPEEITRVKKAGCLLQVNKGSFKGTFGRTAREIAFYMLEHNLADVIASDAHGPYVRTPFLSDIHEMVSEMYSADYAQVLLNENPKAILEDKRLTF